MKNSCLILLKAQLYNQFKLNDLMSKKQNKQKRQALLMGIIYGILAFTLMMYSFGLAFGLVMLGAGDVIPGYAVMITGIITLFFTMIKTNGVIFGFRDYDMLMSLPVKTSTVIHSRFLSMYIMNTLFTGLIMIPMGIAYCIFQHPPLYVYLFWIIGILTASLFPTTIATVLGALIIAVSSRTRHTTAITTILSFVVTFGIIGLSMSLGNSKLETMDMKQLANIGIMLSEQINKIYPFASLFTHSIVDGSWVNFLLFLGVSIGWYYLFVQVVSLQYKKLNTGLMTHHRKGNYQLQELKADTPILALYKKEFKRFFSSSLYVLNIGIGMVMMIVAAIVCFILGPDKLENMMQVPGLSDIFHKIIPFIMSAMLSMSCTTCVSLSLEGKNLWILQSSPLSAKTIFLSKIYVNLTLLVPAAVITSLLISIRFHTDIISDLLLLVILIVYSVFAAVWGMFMNIKFPNFEWESETAVIKQGMSSFLGMMGGMLIGALPIGFIFIFNMVDYRIVQTGAAVVVAIITGLLYRRICKATI